MAIEKRDKLKGTVTKPTGQRAEDQFTDEVQTFFCNKLASSNLRNQIECLAKKAILRDLTVGPLAGRKTWTYIFGFQQQDIILTTKDRNQKLPLLQEGRKSGLVEYHWIEKGQDHLIPPLVICELKTPVSMNTHAFIVYGKIAEQIKSVYPFCAYYFILSSNKKRHLMPHTVYRQAKAFDRVYLEWEEDKERIWEDVERHLIYLKEQLDIMKE